MTSTQLKLVRDDPRADGDAEAIEATLRLRIERMQTEIDALRGELDQHHRRDRALHGQMDRLDEEMRLAARLQRDFLPKTLPEVGRVRFRALFRPAGYVSGDLYDVQRLDEDHVGFYLADAVGHGMPAALLTMFLKRALTTKEITPGGYRLLEPWESMARLNESLVEQDLAHATFATALCGWINTTTLETRFARGGHPNPILMSRDGAIREPLASGGLLGIFADERFEPGRVDLASGDRLFIYSDGAELIFCDDEHFDPSLWRDALRDRHAMGTDELLADLGRCIDTSAGSLDPKDDMTIVVVEAI